MKFPEFTYVRASTFYMYRDPYTFKNDPDRELCFIDTIHPNDLGFAKMAAVIEPVIKKILEG